MVGKVASEMPEAINFGSLLPCVAITSNTEIIPVTVPSKPSIGQMATRTLIKLRF
ncbi:Uncharacterised protein [Vibrio cholerae]|nr:Uncharacterised protein [Vibrio cholerae]